jgi:hypothetical protein
MTKENTREIEKLKSLVDIMSDAISIMQEIINTLDGPIPSNLVDKLVKLGDKAERIKNAN